jgi:hypothetical protein
MSQIKMQMWGAVKLQKKLSFASGKLVVTFECCKNAENAVI